MSFPSHFLTHLLKASIPIRKKNHLYLLARNLLIRVQMLRPMSVLKEGQRLCMPWELKRRAAQHVSLQLKAQREEKIYFYDQKKKKGFSDSTTKNIKQSMNSLYTACFPPVFFFFLESHFFRWVFALISFWLLSTPFNILTKRSGITFPRKILWTVLPLIFFFYSPPPKVGCS